MSLSLYSQTLIDNVGAAFDIFDTEGNGTVDVREVGTILRYLGVYPSEAQLHSLILELQSEEPTMFVSRAPFVACACRIIANSEIEGPTPEDLVRAFQTLDSAKSGFLEADQVRVYLTTMAERLTSEEVENFITFATDAESGLIDWKGYTNAVVDILWNQDY